MIAVEVIDEVEGWPAEADHLVRRAVEAAFAAAPTAPQGPVEISVLLTNDAAVQRLNCAWRGKDKATNVLSFPAPSQPGSPGPQPLGDIALALETVVREAEADEKTVADHLSHLVVHGTLHLLGHDHVVAAEADAMEAIEVAALGRLGIADPYRGMAAA